VVMAALGFKRCGRLGVHGQREFVELIGIISELRSRGCQFFGGVRGQRGSRRWSLGSGQKNRRCGQRGGEFTASELTHRL
jgi:hypothetical protein